MTNVAIIRSSVALFAVKLTETAVKTGFLRNIFHTNHFSYQVWSRWRILNKTFQGTTFSRNMQKNPFVRRHNNYFDVFLYSILIPLIIMQFSSNWRILFFHSSSCIGLQTSDFGLYLYRIWRLKNNGKTVKIKICENVKTKRRFWLILSRW